MMKFDYKALFFSITGALFLLGFAFYNGYPLVYSDTSTYIASGFSLEPPADRPITYGLFIRFVSLNGMSLWPVAFVQSLILSYLILLTIKDFTQLKNPYGYFLFVIAFLSFLTVISFVSSQIITDIFPATGILCILHLSLNHKLMKFSTILLFVLFFISNAMHMSHLLLNILLLGCIFLAGKYFFEKTIQLNKTNILVLVILTILGIATMGSSLAKSKNIFFMARMAENGILVDFLEDNCTDKKYRLCDCIDSIPANTTDFLWDEKSPLYTRYARWSDAQDDFGKIIRQTIFKPKYLVRHVYESGKSTFKQLLAFSAGDGTGPFIGETLLFKRIKQNFRSESNEYSLSKQNQGLMSADKLENLNRRYYLVIIFSFLGMLFIYYSGKLRNMVTEKKRFIIYILLSSIFINSFINASLVIVTDRFGAKLIWMIPFIFLLVVSELDFKRIFRKKCKTD